jgi:nitroreductase
MTTTKLASTKNPIHELLSQRWSPRAFCDRPVEPEKLLSLLEAARWAPSSSNEQPWRFILATRDNPAEFEKSLACLMEGNVAWAKRAYALILTVAKLKFDRSGKPNRHAFHDVGSATENLAIQATALGLVVHPMAGIYPEKAREIFGIPEGYEVVAAVAIGYPADASTLPEGLRERELAPRTRKPLEELIFTGHWGHASPLVVKSDSGLADS